MDMLKKKSQIIWCLVFIVIKNHRVSVYGPSRMQSNEDQAVSAYKYPVVGEGEYEIGKYVQTLLETRSVARPR